LEADKARLQKEVKSTSSKLEGTIKIAAEARQEVDSLKEELEGLKKKLKDEEASRLAVEAWAIEKDDLLRQSSLALLGNTLSAFLLTIALQIQSFVNKLLLFYFSQRLPISLLKPWISCRTIPRRALCR
jgi:chromosome segregation ATPase